jgi:hypothetical protein
MAGSIRICLIADGFFDDFAKCVESIKKFTDAPISIFASGKENKDAEERFGATWQKNKLGWGHSVNYFLKSVSERYIVIMDPSTNFLGDAITPTLDKLEDGYEGVGWRGGLVNVDDDWRSVDDRGVGEVDVIFSYFFAFNREFAVRAGGKLWQLELPLEQGRHHGYHDVDPEYREKKSKENYNRILEKYRGRTEILSPRR